MAYTPAQARATMKWTKTHTKTVNFRLNNEKDARLIEILDLVDNKQGFLKAAILHEAERMGIIDDSASQEGGRIA